ncbi:MAG: NADH-quinone oxidoreductase subunit NuoB [Myxococcales bacterium]|nr:NADH-quinone oxidoreductase subunit NuoB [Myxococcales bacterium]
MAVDTDQPTVEAAEVVGEVPTAPSHEAGGDGEVTPPDVDPAEAQALAAALRSGQIQASRDSRAYTNPLLEKVISVPGLDVAVSNVERLLDWASSSSLFIFPMATSCCGIEFMAAAASRVDLDRMGAIIRPTPRQCDVMVVAGTITVKMAPRVRKLWDQMPEPKWCVAMGSCAISGDFYRDIYSVVPGIDTFVPVDVYVPGCPPNPEELMKGLKRLQVKIAMQREGTWEGSGIPAEERPETASLQLGGIKRIGDPARDPDLFDAQREASRSLGFDGNERRTSGEQHGNLLDPSQLSISGKQTPDGGAA